jgi:hypothetical protein
MCRTIFVYVYVKECDSVLIVFMMKTEELVSKMER